MTIRRSSLDAATRAAAVVVGTGLTLAACTSRESTAVEKARTGTRADRIQGGVSEAGSTFAVAILEGSGGICSGTLIAPNLVLTARHCVADDDGGSFVRCSQDRFASPRAASNFHVSLEAVVDSSEYDVTKILVPTETLFCGNDVALLILDKLVPTPAATPATPALVAPLSKHGTKITAIGHGTSAPGADDDGQRRRRDAVPIQCIPGDGALDCDPQDYFMTAAELAAGDGLCEGDSGSGAFSPASLAAGAPIVIGVLSRASDDGVSCADAVYERTDAKAAFLVNGASEAAKAGGYALPAWAGGTLEPPPEAGAPPPAPSGGEEPSAADPPASAPPPTTTTTTSCAVTTRGHGQESRLGAFVALVALLARRRRR